MSIDICMKGGRRAQRPFNGHADAVRVLISRGAEVNKHEPCNGNIALREAAEGGHRKAAICLLDHGAGINAQDKLGFTPSLLLKTAISLLLTSLSSVLISLKYGYSFEGSSTPLTKAAQKGHLEIVRLLVEKGVVVDQPANDGQTRQPLVKLLSKVILRLLISSSQLAPISAALIPMVTLPCTLLLKKVIPSLFLDYIRFNCFEGSRKATDKAIVTTLRLRPIEYLKELYAVKTSPEYIDELNKVQASCVAAVAGASAATGVKKENAAAAPSSTTKRNRQSVAGFSSPDFLKISKDIVKMSKEVNKVKKMLNIMVPAMNQGFMVNKHTAKLVTSSFQQSQEPRGQNASPCSISSPRHF